MAELNKFRIRMSEPLVSVIIYTYNSEKYVLETLESVKKQTYRNIELVISDDCSQDNTVNLCKSWLEGNKSCFIDVALLLSAVNTGIAPNLNRGIRASKGEWIKTIAGDDLLIENSIENYVNYVTQHKCNVLAAKRHTFFNNDISNLGNDEDNALFNRDSITAAKQYQVALRGNGAPHNTWFMHKSFVESIGLYDEEFRMMEDWPMKLKVLRSGEKIHFLDKYTVYYRVHDSSLSGSNTNKIYSEWYIQWFLTVKQKLMIPYLPWDEKLAIKYDIFVSRLFYKSFLNNYNYFNRAVNYFLKYPVVQSRKYFMARLAKKIEMRS